MHKQSGNAASLTVIILLVIILAGALGYIFYKNANPDTQTETQSQEVVTTEEPTEPAVIEQEGYLSVQEWGIKLKTSNAPKLMYYPEEQVSGQGEMLGLARKPSEIRDPVCSRLGIDVYRQQTEPEFNSKKIGNYYYYVTGSPSKCSDNPLENATQAAILQEVTVDNISEL